MQAKREEMAEKVRRECGRREKVRQSLDQLYLPDYPPTCGYS